MHDRMVGKIRVILDPEEAVKCGFLERVLTISGQWYRHSNTLHPDLVKLIILRKDGASLEWAALCQDEYPTADFNALLGCKMPRARFQFECRGGGTMSIHDATRIHIITSTSWEMEAETLEEVRQRYQSGLSCGLIQPVGGP